MRFWLVLALIFVISGPLWGQKTGKISGYVRDAKTEEPLIGVTIRLQDTAIAGVTDYKGFYSIDGIPVGNHNVEANYLGYQKGIKYDVLITSGNARSVNFNLREMDSTLEEVTIKANPFARSPETVNSLSMLSREEITKYPGGNNDVAKVVQSLPGVSGTPAFRNDVIIRGGAPNENVYYLDGIEIPNLNHFATQGAAGGPAGMINVAFIEEVSLNTSSFPARYSNPLSGVLQFDQRDGNPEEFQGNARLSATEFGLTVEGPLSKEPQTTFIASVRRSYLQLLFQLIDLPFLPSYWDYQFKVNHQLDSANSLNLIGLGSIDDFSLNPPERPQDPSEEELEEWFGKLDILNGIPIQTQQTNTIGLSWRHRTPDGYYKLIASDNILWNNLERYKDNQAREDQVFNIDSREEERKLRFRRYHFWDDWSLEWGAEVQNVDFRFNSFQEVREDVVDSSGKVLQPGLTVDFNSDLNFFRYGGFAQLSKEWLGARLSTSLGLRMDGNSFTTQGNRLWQTLSPRLGIAYNLTEKWQINASAGRYYKIPPYTVLAFRDSSGRLANQNADYIRSDHLTAGVAFSPRTSSRITLEGFYKNYENYPVSVDKGISLANLGGDFGVLGNEETVSTGEGRTYGLELSLRQKLQNNLYGILAYTLYWSEFSGLDGRLIPSAWDNRHLISLTGGYKLPRNWEIGLRFRLLGRAPYTPIDSAATLASYEGRGTVLDWEKVNSKRLAVFDALDVRVDKKWNFKHFALQAYLEIQNAYGATSPEPPNYTLQRNDQGQVVQPRQLTTLNLQDSTILPVLGAVVFF